MAIAGTLLIGCLTLVAIELMGTLATRRLAGVHLLYVPAESVDYDAYLATRDPLLGWPASGGFDSDVFELDTAGSRVIPEFPDPESPSCVALFGDSFTWGAEVDASHTYGNLLAGLIGCRVENFGVPGYGTDQAFLRYRDRVKTNAPIVVLAHFTEDIIRNVNQYRGFISNAPLGFKPRFVLGEDGELRLVPFPNLSREEFQRFPEEWPRYLRHEYFAPGGAAGITTLRRPHAWTVISALRQYRIRAQLIGVPSYAAFYSTTHDSGALAVTTAILKGFVDTAERRGQFPIVMLLPDQKDLQLLRTTGVPPYAPLVDALRNSGISTPPVDAALLKGISGGSPCDVYTFCGTGHFNASGNRIVALTLRSWIAEHYRKAFIPQRTPMTH